MLRQQGDIFFSIPQWHITEMENGKRTIGKGMAKRFGKVLNISYKVFYRLYITTSEIQGTLCENWDTSTIRSFFEEIFIRNEYLYKNVYEFLLHSTYTYT